MSRVLEVLSYGLNATPRKKSLFIVLLLLSAAPGTDALEISGQEKHPTAKGPKVLVIGDSHLVGDTGARLIRLMTAGRYDISLYAVSAASIEWWLSDPRTMLFNGFRYFPYGPDKKEAAHPAPGWASPDLPSVAAFLERKPDIVVFGLGSNRGGDPGAMIRLLKARSPSSKCYWIAPPPVKCWDFNEFRASFRRKYGKTCRLVDSGRVLARHKDDRCHYGGRAAEDWAQDIFDKISSRTQRKNKILSGS